MLQQIVAAAIICYCKFALISTVILDKNSHGLCLGIDGRYGLQKGVAGALLLPLDTGSTAHFSAFKNNWGYVILWC